MVRVPGPRVSLLGRALAIGVLAPLLATVFLVPTPPAAAAAPVPPHFGPNVLVNQPPAFAGSTSSLRVGSDGVAYLAFTGWGGSTTQSDIFFSKSSDGRTWTIPIRVNNDTGGTAQQDPALALDASNNIVIAWMDSRNGSYDIFFAKSTDGGRTFPSNVRVHEALASDQTEADLAVDPENSNLIHVVWTDARSVPNGQDIFYANSTNGGVSFSSPSRRLNSDATSAGQSQPAIAVAPNRDVYVAWTDPKVPARGADIYLAKSTNRGSTWTTNADPVNDDPDANVAQDSPAIAVNETGAIFVAWTDQRSANTTADIWAARSTDGGGVFMPNVKVNDDVGLAFQATPSLAVAAGTVEVAWTDTRTAGSTNWDIYAASSEDGLSWSPNVRVNDDSQIASQAIPSVGVDGSGDVFVAWLDYRGSGFGDVYATVLDRVAPTAVGGGPVTTDEASPVSFDGGGSTDNLGIASFSWDFGDGSSRVGGPTTHAYADPGVYTATLTVWDYSGNSATATRVITVRDTQAPVPRGGGDREVEEGQPLFFDASASTDNVAVTTYLWDFGDGSNATTATASHVYTRQGTYTARLTIRDAAGNSATTSFAVTVRANSDLGLILLLGGFLAALASVIAVLGGILLRMRKRLRVGGPAVPATQQPGSSTPAREPDPLDMTFPPEPP
jgi:PKD domain